MKLFTGRVAPGIGYGVKATQLPWFRGAIQSLAGFDLAPGTLNLAGVSPIGELRELLLTFATVLVPPSRPACCALLLPVRMMHPRSESVGALPAVIVRPLVRTYPAEQVELVASHHLRTLLHLNDGDQVTFAVESAPDIAWIQAQS